jgi:predicted PurR-regulated permease PerM
MADSDAPTETDAADAPDSAPDEETHAWQIEAEAGVPHAGVAEPGGPDSKDSPAAARRRRILRGSLFGPPREKDADNPYGEPGPPMSKSSAFYRGFVGAVGVLLALALALIVREVQSVLVLILVATFLALGLNPIVEVLLRRGFKRGWAVLVVALLVLGALALVAFVLVGVLQDQVAGFIRHLPHLLRNLRQHATIRHLEQKYHVIEKLEHKLRNPDLGGDLLRDVFNSGLNVLRGVLDAVVLFVLTMYFLAALPQLKRAMYSLAPASRRGRVGRLGDEILRRVGGYVIGAFLVALLAGTVTALLLVSVGLGQYALPLALIVAMLDLVPLVGSIIGASSVCVVGLATSLHVGIACIVFYLIYEPLEGYVIYPRVMRSSVDVPEYVTIMAVLLGGTLGGIVGALLALPIAAAVLLLVREVWVRRQDAS